MRIGIALLLFATLPLFSQEDHGLTPADIERGGQIFLSNCASCHGPDGDGVSGVNLASNKFRRASTERELIGIIQNGIPGTPMPPGNYPDQVAGWIAGAFASGPLCRISAGASVSCFPVSATGLSRGSLRVMAGPVL
jgi:mono/diheme cytochrome c family protein